MTGNIYFGLLVFVIIVLLYVFTINWKKKSAWIGLILLIVPYIHLFIAEDTISSLLQEVYSDLCVIGLVILSFNAFTNDFRIK